MRLVVVMILALVSCSGGSTFDPEPECPDRLIDGCDADLEGKTCHTSSGTTCHCRDGGLTCTDCPDGELPIGACSAGASCSVFGFENSCACTCGAAGEWSCSLDDPSPNFHCSF